MKKMLFLLSVILFTTVMIQAQKPQIYRDSITVTADKKDILFINVQNWIKDNYSNKYLERYEKSGDGWRNMPTLMVEKNGYGLAIEFPSDSMLICVFRDLRKDKTSPINYKPIVDDLKKAVTR